MSEIELTEQQRQAIQAARGAPVAVVDLVTGQRYVLVTQGQSERTRSTTDGHSERSAPAATDAPSAPAAEPVQRYRLRDLPTPAEVAEEAKRWCKLRGGSRREVEEQFKLQYYFGGQEIYKVRTHEGPVVVPIPQRYRDTPGLRYVLLTAEERSSACYTIPSRFNDTIHEILM